VHWNISSPGWAKHAWSCFFAPWNAGATIFIYNYARFNAPAALDVLVKHKVTSLCAPPTVWRMLMQQDLAKYKTSLRELVGAGEPLNPEVIDIVQRAWGITIRDGFGQTETTAQVGNPPGQKLKPGSMGRPLPGYDVRLLDVDGNPADEGEICLSLSPRPIALMLGYQDDDEKTSEAMRDGHYHTGDVASRDADGYITYVGRADDVFKASDYRISPFELESVLIEPSRGWRRTSASASSNSASCRRRCPARSAASSCASARTRASRASSGPWSSARRRRASSVLQGRTSWMIARMLPSVSLNQAALAPIAVIAPLGLRSPGRPS
jgi:acyl-CoA synthetase (AMP-forming)/AMP-acid ligase II